MDNHHIPMLLTWLLYESENPDGALEEIKRVVEILERALTHSDELNKDIPPLH